MPSKLTLPKISELGGGDVREITKVNAAKSDIDEVDDLGPCVELQRLDLKDNALNNVASIGYATALTWLDLSKNAIDSIAPLAALTSMRVLNLSYNNITIIDPLSEMKALCSAVLNNNNIRDASALQTLLKLNTIILSHNRVEVLDVRRLKGLKKLAVSGNKFRKCPEIGGCFNLKELRLNKNKLTTIPADVLSCAQLCILDVGGNILTDLDKLSVIKNLRFLRALNVHGNKFPVDDACIETFKEWLPSLRVLDGSPVQGRHKRFLHGPSQQDSTGCFTEEGAREAKKRKFAKRKRPDSDPETTTANARISFADPEDVDVETQGSIAPVKRSRVTTETTTTSTNAATTPPDAAPPAARGSDRAPRGKHGRPPPRAQPMARSADPHAVKNADKQRESADQKRPRPDRRESNRLRENIDGAASDGPTKNPPGDTLSKRMQDRKGKARKGTASLSHTRADSQSMPRKSARHNSAGKDNSTKSNNPKDNKTPDTGHARSTTPHGKPGRGKSQVDGTKPGVNSTASTHAQTKTTTPRKTPTKANIDKKNTAATGSSKVTSSESVTHPKSKTPTPRKNAGKKGSSQKNPPPAATNPTDPMGYFSKAAKGKGKNERAHMDDPMGYFSGKKGTQGPRKGSGKKPHPNKSGAPVHTATGTGVVSVGQKKADTKVAAQKTADRMDATTVGSAVTGVVQVKAVKPQKKSAKRGTRVDPTQLSGLGGHSDGLYGDAVGVSSWDF